MAFKLSLICATLIFVIVYSHCLGEADAFCSLEKMKKFAVEACEHLFPNDEPASSSSRQKREYHHRTKSNEFGHHTKQKHMFAVRRSSFPRGGYLKVAQTHLEHLSQLDIFPMYKPHISKKHHGGDRHKRNAHNNDVALPYCCYNKCDEDFFCR